MTDNEIIKAYKQCQTKNGKGCVNCPFEKGAEDSSCLDDLKQATFDLLNRQKAEIERLREKNETLFSSLDSEISLNRDLTDIISSANFEAIKEFWKSVREYAVVMGCFHIVEQGDRLAKELTEKNDFKE